MIHLRSSFLRTFAFTASLLALAVVFNPAGAMAGMQITEWMYNGSGASSAGEFVEFTNLGTSSVDMTGWSFDDDSRTPGSQVLSAFGIVQPGESVILTDNTEANFRADWSAMPPTVKVIGGNANNLGRSDEINLYDKTNALVDRLTYNDQGSGNAKGPRTNSVSGNPISLADVGTNNASRWVLSSVSPTVDRYGSFTSTLGEIGNPGAYVDAVPEPGTIAILIGGLPMAGAFAGFRRRK